MPSGSSSSCITLRARLSRSFTWTGGTLPCPVAPAHRCPPKCHRWRRRGLRRPVRRRRQHSHHPVRCSCRRRERSGAGPGRAGRGTCLAGRRLVVVVPQKAGGAVVRQGARGGPDPVVLGGNALLAAGLAVLSAVGRGPNEDHRTVVVEGEENVPSKSSTANSFSLHNTDRYSQCYCSLRLYRLSFPSALRTCQKFSPRPIDRRLF
jgi:hypothetical protein